MIASNDLWLDTLNKRSAPADKCTAFINYPDTTLFRPSVTRKSQSTPFVFLYPGSLNHHQGVDLAVSAFAAVRHQMPGAELHIYGRGPALPMLHELIRSLALDDAIRIKDFLPSVQIAKVMGDASVGVVPKRADGFGNEAFSTKILEFMACGVPVVVARTRVDEYYFSRDVLTFFEAGNVESLAAALLDVYRSPIDAKRKATAALTLARSMSWQTKSPDYRSLVDSVAEQRIA